MDHTDRWVPRNFSCYGAGRPNAGAQVDTIPKDLEKLKSRTSRGSETITTSLKKAIQGGLYAYNERLPPERELAEAFNAARGTVRRALDELEAMGLVARRVGRGTFVKFAGQYRQSTSDIAEVTSPLQLIEIRTAIEPYMARLACLHATRRDINSMKDVITRLEQSENDLSAFSKLDSEFHLLMAQCSGNPLIVHLFQQIDEVRRHTQWSAKQRQVLTVKNRRLYNEQHRRIFACIEKRDGQAAAQRVTEHLAKARQDLVGVERS